MARSLLRSWRTQAVLVVMAIVAVLTAPLATPGPTGGDTDTVVVSGARSLSDQVSVDFARHPGERTTDIHVLAFNDLHGNLEAGGLNIYGQFAGGAAYLAKAVKDRQTQYGRRQATVVAGDNIGASPLANGLFHEEPITIVSNLMDVDFAGVGNHEFDKGAAELRRIQDGGCHPEGCTGAPYARANGRTTDRYPGADFQYLSANVTVDRTGRTLFPAFGIEKFRTESGRRVKVGFIGEVSRPRPPSSPRPASPD